MTAYWDQIQGYIQGFADTPTVLATVALFLFFVAYGGRRIRTLIIFLAQYGALLALAIAAAVAGRYGYAAGAALGKAQGFNETGQLYYGVGGAAAFGLAGFVAAGLVLAVFFVLLDIRQNTRG
jgi:hypothetical protein